MDRDRRLATLASLALFVSMFLPWYQQNGVGKTGIESRNLDAFQVFSFVEAAVLLVARGPDLHALRPRRGPRVQHARRRRNGRLRRRHLDGSPADLPAVRQARDLDPRRGRERGRAVGDLLRSRSGRDDRLLGLEDARGELRPPISPATGATHQRDTKGAAEPPTEPRTPRRERPRAAPAIRAERAPRREPCPAVRHLARSSRRPRPRSSRPGAWRRPPGPPLRPARGPAAVRAFPPRRRSSSPSRTHRPARTERRRLSLRRE